MAAVVLATINAKWIHPSLALRLLKANLKDDSGSFCVIREFALRQNLAEKTAAILSEAPRILGLSVSVWNHAATAELLRALEAAWGDPAGGENPHPPRPVVVLGGPEVTGLLQGLPPAPESPPPAENSFPAAELFGFADFVIRGEGEEIFPELCRAILEDPAGARKRYGKYINAPPADLPAVKTGYDLYDDEDLRRKLIYVETSRGCPYTCAFCQSAVKNAGGPLTRGPADRKAAVREFSLAPLLADLEKLVRRIVEGAALSATAARTIKVLDRSFNVNVPRALRILEFCLEAVETARRGGVSLQFHFEMVPLIFPEELRRLLCRFPPGCLRLEIGIQSLNSKTCALIHRVSNPEAELEVLHFLRTKTAAVIHADLIAGLPGEDRLSFGEGFDRLWLALTERNSPAESGADGSGVDSPPFEIQPGILKCLPGTPLRATAENGGFTVRYGRTAPYEVIETDRLPPEDMEEIKNFARFWELLVNRRPFPELLPELTPPGEPVFRRFMGVSQKLFFRFGRNWGIPKDELKEAVLAAMP
jgi:radical SAM superfamily enzyme YgiQ (UPF0313 family)